MLVRVHSTAFLSVQCFTAWLLGTPGKMGKRRKVHPFFSFNLILFFFNLYSILCVYTCATESTAHMRRPEANLWELILPLPGVCCIWNSVLRLRSSGPPLMIRLTGPLILNSLNWRATLFFHKSNCWWGLWNVQFHKNWSKDSRHVVYMAFLSRWISLRAYHPPSYMAPRSSDSALTSTFKVWACQPSILDPSEITPIRNRTPTLYDTNLVTI